MSEAAFLAAICANPEDDTPRLVFADWLDEHERPVRAQFIRDQIELANLDEADPRYPALLARMRRCGVLTDSAHRFEAEASVYGAMFRRGFVAGIEANGYVPPSFEQLPVEQLRLGRPESDPYGTVEELAARPELAKLRTLRFDGEWMTEKLATLLTNNPRLGALRALSIDAPDDEFGPRIGEIVRHFNLPALDSLAVHFGTFDDNPGPMESWDDFLPASTPSLRRLHLDGHWHRQDADDRPWPGPDYEWLVRTRHFPTLEIAGVRLLEDFGVTAGHIAPPPGGLFERLAGSRLKRLMCNSEDLDVYGRLRSCDWGSVEELTVYEGEAHAAVLGVPQAKNLRRLTLNPWPGSGWASEHLTRAVRDQPLWPKLRHLSCSGCPHVFLRGAFCRNLLRLDVRDPSLNDATEFYADAEFPELRHLTIGWCDSEQTLAPLLTTKTLPNLCTLVVGRLGLSAATLVGLANNPNMPRLSLVGATGNGAHYDWWVLDRGTATPVALGAIPVDEDWWEPDPLRDWFWAGL